MAPQQWWLVLTECFLCTKYCTKCFMFIISIPESECPVQLKWMFHPLRPCIPTVCKGTLRDWNLEPPVLLVLTLYALSNPVLNSASQAYFSSEDGMSWPSDITSHICLGDSLSMSQLTFFFSISPSPVSLGSTNQLPRAWSLLNDWMQLRPWTDTTEIMKAKQNNNKNTKAESRILDPPCECSQPPVSLGQLCNFTGL